MNAVLDLKEQIENMKGNDILLWIDDIGGFLKISKTQASALLNRLHPNYFQVQPNGDLHIKRKER